MRDLSVRPKRLARSMARGAAFGAVIGAGLGMVAGDCCAGIVCLTRAEATAVGAAEGVLIGTIVGIIRGTERWKRVPLPNGSSGSEQGPRVGWALVPVGGRRLGLSVRVDFAGRRPRERR